MNEKRKLTQCDRLELYLKAHPGATNIEITVDCFFSSASKRISDLRKQGKIDTVRCAETNRNGETLHFCRYYLKENNA